MGAVRIFSICICYIVISVETETISNPSRKLFDVEYLANYRPDLRVPHQFSELDRGSEENDAYNDAQRRVQRTTNREEMAKSYESRKQDIMTSANRPTVRFKKHSLKTQKVSKTNVRALPLAKRTFDDKTVISEFDPRLDPQRSFGELKAPSNDIPELLQTNLQYAPLKTENDIHMHNEPPLIHKTNKLADLYKLEKQQVPGVIPPESDGISIKTEDHLTPNEDDCRKVIDFLSYLLALALRSTRNSSTELNYYISKTLDVVQSHRLSDHSRIAELNSKIKELESQLASKITSPKLRHLVCKSDVNRLFPSARCGEIDNSYISDNPESFNYPNHNHQPGHFHYHSGHYDYYPEPHHHHHSNNYHHLPDHHHQHHHHHENSDDVKHLPNHLLEHPDNYHHLPGHHHEHTNNYQHHPAHYHEHTDNHEHLPDLHHYHENSNDYQHLPDHHHELSDNHRLHLPNFDNYHHFPEHHHHDHQHYNDYQDISDPHNQDPDSYQHFLEHHPDHAHLHVDRYHYHPENKLLGLKTITEVSSELQNVLQNQMISLDKSFVNAKIRKDKYNPQNYDAPTAETINIGLDKLIKNNGATVTDLTNLGTKLENFDDKMKYFKYQPLPDHDHQYSNNYKNLIDGQELDLPLKNPLYYPSSQINNELISPAANGLFLNNLKPTKSSYFGISQTERPLYFPAKNPKTNYHTLKFNNGISPTNYLKQSHSFYSGNDQTEHPVLQTIEQYKSPKVFNYENAPEQERSHNISKLTPASNKIDLFPTLPQYPVLNDLYTAIPFTKHKALRSTVRPELQQPSKPPSSPWKPNTREGMLDDKNSPYPEYYRPSFPILQHGQKNISNYGKPLISILQGFIPNLKDTSLNPDTTEFESVLNDEKSDDNIKMYLATECKEFSDEQKHYLLLLLKHFNILHPDVRLMTKNNEELLILILRYFKAILHKIDGSVQLPKLQTVDIKFLSYIYTLINSKLVDAKDAKAALVIVNKFINHLRNFGKDLNNREILDNILLFVNKVIKDILDSDTHTLPPPHIGVTSPLPNPLPLLPYTFVTKMVALLASTLSEAQVEIALAKLKDYTEELKLLGKEFSSTETLELVLSFVYEIIKKSTSIETPAILKDFLIKLHEFLTSSVASITDREIIKIKTISYIVDLITRRVDLTKKENLNFVIKYVNEVIKNISPSIKPIDKIFLGKLYNFINSLVPSLEQRKMLKMKVIDYIMDLLQLGVDFTKKENLNLVIKYVNELIANLAQMTGVTSDLNNHATALTPVPTESPAEIDSEIIKYAYEVIYNVFENNPQRESAVYYFHEYIKWAVAINFDLNNRENLNQLILLIISCIKNNEKLDFSTHSCSPPVTQTEVEITFTIPTKIKFGFGIRGSPKLIKSRVPYLTFLGNLNDILLRKPLLRNHREKFENELLRSLNITEVSSEVEKLPKDQLIKMISRDGSFVEAKIQDDKYNPLQSDIPTAEIFNRTVHGLDEMINNEGISVSDLTNLTNKSKNVGDKMKHFLLIHRDSVFDPVTYMQSNGNRRFVPYEEASTVTNPSNKIDVVNLLNTSTTSNDKSLNNLIDTTTIPSDKSLENVINTTSKSKSFDNLTNITTTQETNNKNTTEEQEYLEK